MSLKCPYSNLSYAAWRLRTLRRLYHGVDTAIGTQLTFLNPRHVHTTLLQTRSLHQSESRARKYIRDLKRTAKFKQVQLELAEHSKSHVESDTQSATQPSKPLQTKNNSSEWNPYDDASLQELQDLVGDLRLKAKQAAEKTDTIEEEGIPFEKSVVYHRKKPNRPESPLERRQPWDRPMKLQVHEVEIDKRLENNVWAQILASPLRMDRGTRARLPRDLMLSWGIMQNPKDGEDYLLPIELSDLEALRQELRQNADTTTAEEPCKHEQQDLNVGQSRTQPTRRLLIAANQILLQSMTDELISVRRTKKGDEVKTNTGKLNGNVVPYRWRLKQDELKAFHKTREFFNETLNRKPDEDEPNLDEMAKFDNLQWQPDIAQRIEKIMKERVLIALEAVASNNVSGRAIHDRRILAIPIPEHGRLYLNEKGSLVESKSAKSARTLEPGREGDTARTSKDPDYIHGAICVHVGSPESYRNTVEQWHQRHASKSQDDSPKLEEPPSYNIIPPLIPINDQYRLPIFNLQTLLGIEHTDRLRQLIKEHKILNLSFWQQRSEDLNRAEREESFEFDTDQSSPDTVLGNIVPNSSLDAGEQILSSIVTPKVDAQLSRPVDPVQSTSSHVPSADESDTPYLILIKPRSKHAPILIREIWQLWRYLGGRDGLSFD